MLHQDHTSVALGEQASAVAATNLAKRLYEFVEPFLVILDRKIDSRLVRTFFALLCAIVRFRDTRHGLLLSELGGYILSPQQAPAGTKRLSNLLRCCKWSPSDISRYLWQQARRRLEELDSQGKDVYAIWDESVLEKPESLAAEGLCAVRSSKAARLKRIKPGYYNPPGGRPIHVPGLHWLGLLLAGLRGPATVAAMHWWTTRGTWASDRRTQEATLLEQCACDWGDRVLHILDAGFAGDPWLSQMLRHHLRFVIRWRKKYLLQDEQGRERHTWQMTAGQRTWEHRQIWDCRRHEYRKVGVLAVPVKQPGHAEQLWLVVSRPGHGRPPWYLLTNEPIATSNDAWRIVFAYNRRWQIELAWRYGKSELAMECPRLWSLQNRRKLLLIVTLVYAFLLSLLAPRFDDARQWLLQTWCPRTGKRSRDATAPLYRLRLALSKLWLAYHPPSLLPLLQNLG